MENHGQMRTFRNWSWSPQEMELFICFLCHIVQAIRRWELCITFPKWLQKFIHIYWTPSMHAYLHMYPTRTEMCSTYKTTDVFWPVLYVSDMLYVCIWVSKTFAMAKICSDIAVFPAVTAQVAVLFPACWQSAALCRVWTSSEWKASNIKSRTLKH